MSGFLIGMAIGLVGVIAMWCGGIWQMNEDDAIAGDAKFLLALGVGIFLAGCAFSVISGAVYDDGHFQPKPVKVASRTVDTSSQGVVRVSRP